jgi:pimeloyl-ACP methyl ester carboxylesterase
MRTHPLMAHAEFGDDAFVETGGYRIHYVEAGSGAPLILIPGSFSTYRVWNPGLPLLAEHHRVFALDYVGVGDSDKPRSGFRYTVGEQADLIAKVIRALRLGRTHIVGASYGGTIAFNLAARHPEVVAKVVSIEGGIVKPESLPGSPVEKWFRYPVLGDLVVGLFKTGWFNELVVDAVAGEWEPLMTANERRRMLRELSFNVRSATRTAWYWIGVSHRTVDPFEEEAKRITAPILYLAGRRSDFREMAACTVRFLEAHLPHAKIRYFEDGIHDLEAQKPYEVAEEICRFLEK